MNFDEGQYTNETLEEWGADHPDNPINKKQNIMENNNRFKFIRNTELNEIIGNKFKNPELLEQNATKQHTPK